MAAGPQTTVGVGAAAALPFLFNEDGRRIHRHWWTCVPALPAERDSRLYRSLRQIWMDHTTNTNVPGLGRGVPAFFDERHEDHQTVALFQPWSGVTWTSEGAASLLRFLGSRPRGEVTGMSWAYQVQDRRAPGIADIVIHWEDAEKRAVTVVEAKHVHDGRPATINAKDVTGGPYRSFPSFLEAGRTIDFVLLVDERDLAKVWKQSAEHPTDVAASTEVRTWQDMLAWQIVEFAHLSQTRDVDKSVLDTIIGAIIERSRHLGVEPTGGPAGYPDPLADATGTTERYEAIRERAMPESVTEILIGFEVVLAAQKMIAPSAPYVWLADEPDALTARMSDEDDWYARHWHLDWPCRPDAANETADV